jgi:hypothetical protein
MTDTQRALREAFFKQEERLAHLVDDKPENPSNLEKAAFCEAMFDFRAAWLHAVGFRDGLQKACQLAGIQGFEEAVPSTTPAG